MQSKRDSPVPRDLEIGMESCGELRKGNCKRREYPPAIQLLVRTENEASSHMLPWVLKRHYTGDGRLILTEERVRRREFFRAHRSGGRLTLHLVAVDEEENEDENEDEDEGGYKYDHNVRGRDGGFMFGVAVPARSLRTVRS